MGGVPILNEKVKSHLFSHTLFDFEVFAFVYLHLYVITCCTSTFDASMCINQSIKHRFHIHQGLWRPWTATDRDLVPFEPQ